ncbi:hypothetical protein FOA52_016199 [Chlamydomonas sp. UWO 241]|nr:hypothetical protein FOA52_016199 [Chlamydomonas sp. UWO 241]
MEDMDDREYRLASKYTALWVCKVFPRGTTAIPLTGDVGTSGVWHIDIRSDQDELDTVFPAELPELRPGALVHNGGKSVVRGPFPPGFPAGCRFLPVRKEHWSNNRPDFMTVSFHRPTRVYILLPSLMQEPRWLRALFNKLRDPLLMPIEVKVKWDFDTPEWLTFLTMGKIDAVQRQTLRAFKSDSVYSIGRQLVLGGPGLADIMDTGFVIAFKPVDITPPRSFPAAHHVHPGLLQASVKFAQGTAAAAPRQSHAGGYTPITSMDQVPEGQKSGSWMLGARESTNGGSPIWRSSTGGDSLGGEPASNGGYTFDYAEWMFRVIKAVRRNRLMELRALIEVDLSQPPHVSHLANHDVSVLPESEKEALLTDIPYQARQLEILCLLVHKAHCSVGYMSLRFLINHFEDVPAIYGGGCQGLLLHHVRNQLSPISVVAAIMRVMRLEIADRVQAQSTVALTESLALFQQLQGVLLGHAQVYIRDDVVAKEALNAGSKLIRLKALLDFKLFRSSLQKRQKEPDSLADFRPLRVAFADNDAVFMHAPIVEAFVRLSWKGQDYLQETAKGQVPTTLSILNPGILAVVLTNHGFVPEGFKTMIVTSKLWHLHTFSSQAFFNSPRAHWVMRVMSTIVFLVLYVQVAGALFPSWHGPSYALHSQSKESVFNVSLFVAWTIGNVIETAQMLLLRTTQDAIRMLAANKSTIIYLVLDVFMLGISIVFLFHDLQVYTLDELMRLQLEMSWAALAPVMWGSQAAKAALVGVSEVVNAAAQAASKRARSPSFQGWDHAAGTADSPTTPQNALTTTDAHTPSELSNPGTGFADYGGPSTHESPAFVTHKGKGSMIEAIEIREASAGIGQRITRSITRSMSLEQLSPSGPGVGQE